MKKSIISVMLIAIFTTTINIANAQRSSTSTTGWVKVNNISNVLKTKSVSAVYNFTFSDMANPSGGIAYLATNKGGIVVQSNSSSSMVSGITGACYYVSVGFINNKPYSHFANSTQMVTVSATTGESSAKVGPAIEYHYTPFNAIPNSYAKSKISKITGVGICKNYGKAVFGSDKGVIRSTSVTGSAGGQNFAIPVYQKLQEDLNTSISALSQINETSLAFAQGTKIKTIEMPSRNITNTRAIPSGVKVAKIIIFNGKAYLSPTRINSNLYDSEIYTLSRTNTYSKALGKIHGLDYIHVNNKILKITAIKKTANRTYVSVVENINGRNVSQIYSIASTINLPKVDYAKILSTSTSTKR